MRPKTLNKVLKTSKMYNHGPENYTCPICPAVNGIENQDTLIKQSDIVYKDELIYSLFF